MDYRILLSSTLEECLASFGKPHIAIGIENLDDFQIAELKKDFSAIAKSRGYPSLIWKRDDKQIYAF